MNTSQYWFSAAASADLGDEITNSLRFHNSNTVLHRTQEGTNCAGDPNFTFATWFKLGFIGEQNIFGFHGSSSENWILRWTTANQTFGSRDESNGHTHWDTTPNHRDNTGWYHLLVQCTNRALDLYVNGEKVGSQIAASHHNDGFDQSICIGAENTSGGSSMQGYLADTYFIQGAQLHPINDGFVRTNEDGVLVPDTPTISSYGDNGFHLDYADASDPGKDVSGQGHHFTAVGFDTASISASNESNDTGHVDTPTLLYAQYNRVAMHSSQTTSQANLQTSASSYTWAPATIAIPADCGKKFYWEVTIRNNSGNETLGMVDPTQRLGQAPLHGWVFCPPLNSIESDQGNISTVVDTGATSITTGNGTTYMFAYDADTQNVWIGDSGNWYRRNGASGNGDPANNSNPFLTTSDGCIVDGELYAPATAGSSAGTTAYEINFGQMDFVHTVPSGFEHLNSTNLPEPTIKNGSEYFDAVTWSGNGTSQSITGLEFQPDLVWIKKRNSPVQSHVIHDSLGGTGVNLRPNTSDGYVTSSNYLTAFNSDGFSLAGDSGVNDGSGTYVAWCWKAGGAPTATNSNSAGAAQTAGSVKVDDADSSFAQGSIAVKKMSVNTEAGFSIVEYQGTGSAGTIPHGLGAVPEFAIFKRHDGTSSWEIYHKVIGNTKTVQFSDAAETSANAAYWNNTSPTSTLFSIGAGGVNNTNNEQVISYIWTPIEGFSKFGQYVGNNSADGPFAYTGFRPAFVLIKRKDNSFGGEWSLFDSTRNTSNPTDLLLTPTTNAAERTGLGFEIHANGFKIRNAGDWQNQNGGEYIYAAFAENPFVGENVPPATAR